MKTYYPTYAALLAAVLLASAPAWAQQKEIQRRGIVPGSVRVQRAPPGPAVKLTPLELIAAKRVTLSLKDASAEEALTKLLDLSGFGYEFDSAFYPDTLTAHVVGSKGSPLVEQVIPLDLPPRRITMKLVNASLANALDSVCQALGVGWSTSGPPDSVPTIRILRTGATRTRADIIDKLVEKQNRSMGGGLGGGGFGGGSYAGRDDRLLNVSNAFAQVSVDGKDKPVRDTLIEVFKAAQVEYVFDEDVAQAPNITVSLRNVSLRTALDALCESAGLGWTTESALDPRNSGTQIIRVGKRYAPAPPK